MRGSRIRTTLLGAGALTLAAVQLSGCGEVPMRGDAVRVLSFNLWVGGESGGQPLSQSVEVVRKARADIVGLQETGGEERAGERPDNGRKLAEILGWSYLDQGQGRGIVTRWKVIEATAANWGARIEIAPGREVFVFNAHFHHAPYQPYQLLDIPYANAPFLRTEAEAVRAAKEARGVEVTALLEEIEPALATGRPVFLTGDFNEPSYLDWSEAAARAGKCPLRVEWPSAQAIAAAGLVDSFRSVHPDVVRDRGNTWTPTTKETDPKDRHDRIDFVFAGGRGVQVLGAEVVGEDSGRADIVVTPYPSDHRAVVATFELPRDETQR